MTKAIVDTTIITDILLNTGHVRSVAEKALSKFEQTMLPVYAIKEFKAGPLSNFVWMHNKLSMTNSYEKALDALHRMSRTPRMYTTSTAIQGLRNASKSIAKETPATLEKKYGKAASIDQILCDEFRLALKMAIFKAWKKRRKITTEIIQPLHCYVEKAPFEKRGLIELEPRTCMKHKECGMALVLQEKPEDLKKMRDAINLTVLSFKASCRQWQ